MVAVALHDEFKMFHTVFQEPAPGHAVALAGHGTSSGVSGIPAFVLGRDRGADGFHRCRQPDRRPGRTCGDRLRVVAAAR